MSSSRIRLFRLCPVAKVALPLIFQTMILGSTNGLASSAPNASESEGSPGALNVNVDVASKSSENILEAGAIISVISENDIKSYGANSLVDVLNRVTSIYFISTYAYPDNMVSIRGDVTDQYNNRVLILIDGRPFRESMFLGDNRTLWTVFPLSMISRVEILRGPGSILYGTSAFMGVINVVTKEWANDQIYGSITTGGNFRKQGEAGIAKKWGDLQLSLGVNYISDPGWTFSMTDERGNNRSTLMSQEGLGLSSKLKYKEVTLSAFYGQNLQGTIGNTPIWGPDTVPSTLATSVSSQLSGWDYKSYSGRWFLDLGIDHSFNQNHRNTLDITYNKYDFHFDYPNAIENSRTAESSDLLIEWTDFLTIHPRWHLTTGLLYWFRNGHGTEPAFNATGSAYDIYSPGATINPSPFGFVPYHSEIFFSGYGQLEYQPWDPLKLYAGAQLNQAPNLALDSTPRVGAIYTFSEFWTTKLLYGVAFRSPSLSERYRISTSAVGNPNLLPEKIGTVEAQINYHTDQVYISTTVFESNGTNLIGRTTPTTTDSHAYYENIGNSTSYGLEVESRLSLDRWLATTGISYTRVQISGNTDYNGMPPLMAKLGGTYTFETGTSIGLFDQWSGPSAAVSTSLANPLASEYHWLTANARIILNSWLKFLGTKNETVLNIYAINLLNVSVQFPEYLRRMIDTIPGRPGFSVYASLGTTF